jgi:hypothetical protein
MGGVNTINVVTLRIWIKWKMKFEVLILNDEAKCLHMVV